MGNTEGFVQVEVAHIGPKVGGAAEAHLGVHIGPIHVHLAAVAMNEGANGGNLGFKHPVGGGVGDHQRRQVVAVLLSLSPQVGQVNIAILVAGYGHHRHPRHHSAGRVCTVGRLGNQAGNAVMVAAPLVVLANHQQPSVFSLGTGIGLKGNSVEASNFSQPAF